MKESILYAYADGRNFDAIADAVSTRFADFIGARSWLSGSAWAVNQRLGENWELGMNLQLPVRNSEPRGWISDIEEIAIFCRGIAEEHEIEFVLGVAEEGIADDLWHVNSGPLDIEGLCRMLGTGYRDKPA